jgi:hypothetical protein
MLLNRDVFLVDPTTRSIPNDGVAKVVDPRTPEEWAVLRYELASFVCDGEYQNGLERILSSFLAALDQPTQPAVWVSGFYGSGKSHFVRVLEYLWRDVKFDDGATARGLANLPTEVSDLLKELVTRGKQSGGLWSAAGTLSAGTGSVRLGLLAILFGSAGLPEQYPAARFVLWLKREGLYEAVKAGVEGKGRDFGKELNNMYVSPHLAGSLLAAYPTFATSEAEVRSLLKAQYPVLADITDEQFLDTVQDVLRRQAATPGKLPCTLIVFDELQQFIGEDSARALNVQTIVEACCSRFGSRLLFVGTGQSAIQATPQLSKLQGRFTVRVELSDTDVQKVVRQVVLRKDPTRTPALKAVLEAASGEINRHLAGAKIGPNPADPSDLVPEYPLLPVRRRFWERTLRAVDIAGTAGQLRTQLRIVHEAARAVAGKPLGTVIPADFIYDQLKASLLQSTVLLRDTASVIESLRDGTPDSDLRSRLCALVFLIGKLPTEGIAAAGIRADAATLADLTVDDLVAGSASLRQRIPNLLQSLVESGALMVVGDEYRLQTRESAEWEADYRSRLAPIKADDTRLASERGTAFRAAVTAALKDVRLVHGVNKTPRKFDLHFGADAPPATATAAGNVPIWVRDEWTVTEKTVREEAQTAGLASPTVFVFLPRLDPEGLRTALAGAAAAKGTLDGRPRSALPEGIEARKAMESRQATEQKQIASLVATIVANARVYQSGGVEVTGDTFAEAIRTAVERALARLFEKFNITDTAGWDKVVKRIEDGSADALAALGYTGDVDKHPAAQEILAFLANSSKKGAEVRKKFMGAGYGWPQDAVDGALLALITAGFVRATRNGQPASAKEIPQGQIGVVDFAREGVTVSAAQRLAVRKLLADLGLQTRPNEEVAAVGKVLERLTALAYEAGGAPPQPPRPTTETIEELRILGGNELILAAFNRSDELRASQTQWTANKGLIEQRRPRWVLLERLLGHANGLPSAGAARSQFEAILAARTLLAAPDPTAPLIAGLATLLRTELQARRARLLSVRERELAQVEVTTEWAGLSPAERDSLISKHELGPIAELNIGTDAALLDALDAAPLAAWENRIAALPARLARAREEAAKMLEPKAVRVRPRSATLKTIGEVDAYLVALRGEIVEHIEAGSPVIL